jgi:predicted nucleic acid-binding protein
LSQSVAFNISKEKTTQDMMKALTRMYEKPSASNKVFLMKQLFNMKKCENKSMQEHLSDFNTITSQLESVGITFDNEVLALVILSSLPDSWDSLVMAVSNSSGSNVLKFEDVVGVLLDEDTRRKNNSSGDISGTALNIEERGRSSKRGNDRGYGRSQSRKSQSRSTQLTCWNCKKKCHLKRDCRASKKKMEENDKSSTSVNVSNESGSENEALIMCCDSKDDSLWILDSGASFHATSNREYFLNYENGNFGKVYLGDDESCDIIGRGDVQISMPDGRQLRLQRVRRAKTYWKSNFCKPTC